MKRVIKRFNYATRAIVVNGTIEFASMGKFVTDYLAKIKALGWFIEDVTEAEQAAEPHVCDDSCPNDYHYRTGAPIQIQQVSDLSDAGHAAVFEALAALPVQSWVLVLSAMRGLSQSIGDTLNDDPTADYALTRACDAELERLTQRRPFDAEKGLR